VRQLDISPSETLFLFLVFGPLSASFRFLACCRPIFKKKKNIWIKSCAPCESGSMRQLDNSPSGAHSFLDFLAHCWHLAHFRPLFSFWPVVGTWPIFVPFSVFGLLSTLFMFGPSRPCYQSSPSVVTCYCR
jgi:hypothetical protein